MRSFEKKNENMVHHIHRHTFLFRADDWNTFEKTLKILPQPGPTRGHACPWIPVKSHCRFLISAKFVVIFYILR